MRRDVELSNIVCLACTFTFKRKKKYRKCTSISIKELFYAKQHVFGNKLRLSRTLSDFNWLVRGNGSKAITDIVKTEPRHEKTNVLHMQKQRHRSASRS